MRIIRATNYGFRTVIVVLLNPDDPEYVHDDGTDHPQENRNGCLDTLCRLNHKFRDFVFDGEEQFLLDESGNVQRRSAEQFLAEVRARSPILPSPREIVALVGREI